VSFQTWSVAPPFPPDTGRTRTTIGGFVVDYTGATPPTLAQVMAQAAPTPDQIKASQNDQIKASIDSPDVNTRLIIALARQLYADLSSVPAFATKYPTLASWVTAIKSRIDAT
jgi:hypothetical protein